MPFDNLADARDFLYAAMTDGTYQFAQLSKRNRGEWDEVESLDVASLGKTGRDDRIVSTLSARLTSREHEKIVLKLRLARNGGPLPATLRGAKATRVGSLLSLSGPEGDILVAFEAGEITLSVKVDASDEYYEPGKTVATLFEETEIAIVQIVRPDWPLEL